MHLSDWLKVMIMTRNNHEYIMHYLICILLILIPVSFGTHYHDFNTFFNNHNNSSEQCNDGDIIQYITKIHTEYLQRICQDSNLQGLEYSGGLLAKCETCKEEEVVGFVKYEDGKSHPTMLSPSLQCSFCFHKYE